MKALFKNFLPGSQNNRSVDDMIDSSNSNNNKKKREKHSTSTTTNTNNTSDVHSKSSRSLSLFVTNNKHRADPSLGEAHDAVTSSSTLSSMLFSQHQHQQQQQHYHHHSQPLPPLSPQPITSKQNSSSSILSSSSLTGENGNQTKSSPNVMEHVHQQQQQQPSSSSLNGLGSPHRVQSSNSGSSNNNNNINTISSPPPPKRRSSMSNAFRRLSLRRSSQPLSSPVFLPNNSHETPTIGSTVLFADMMMLGASPPSSPTSPPVLFSPNSSSSLSSPSLPQHHHHSSSSTLYFQQQQLGNTPGSVHTPSPSSSFHSHSHHHHHSAGFSEPHLSSSQQQKFNLTSSSTIPTQYNSTNNNTTTISSSNLDYAFPSASTTDYSSAISSPMMMMSQTSSNTAVPRPSGTQQLIEVLNRKKWRDLLCVVQNGSGTGSSSNHNHNHNHNNNGGGGIGTPSSTTSSAHSLVASRTTSNNNIVALNTNNNSNCLNTAAGDDMLNNSSVKTNNTTNNNNGNNILNNSKALDSTTTTPPTTATTTGNISSTTTTPSMTTTTTSSTTVVTPSLSTSSLLMMNNGNRMPSPNSPVAISVISEDSSSSSSYADVGDSLINDLDQKPSDELSPNVVHVINSDALNLSTSMMASVNNSSTASSNSNIGATLALNNLDRNNDEKSFALTNSPNEAIFRAIILGGFLSLKDVLHSCDLVCKSWHLRISHSRENLIYFLPQLLSSIQVWEEKSDLQIKLATQIAWNLNNMEISKRALVVLFGLYKRSLHKEKIFNRAVFKEVVKPEVPELLGQTDKSNMFYRLSSPAWFSPYSCFDCPIYLYLAKRCLRSIEKKDGEFQHRVQVLLKLKPTVTNHGEGSFDSNNTQLQPYHSSQYLNLSNGSISPSMSPLPSGGRKLVSSIVVGTQARPLGETSSYASSASSSKYLEISPEKMLHHEMLLSPSSPILSSASPTNTLLRGNAQTLADMIKELKSNWFFVYGVADRNKSTMEDRVIPSSDVTTSTLAHHHEKPKLVRERIIRYFSHFSLAKMKEEYICAGAGDGVESENFALLDKNAITEKSNQITANIEKCYLEMSQFVKDTSSNKCPSIEGADPSLCECFDKSMTLWICELQKLGFLKIDFVLQYLLKLLLLTCCGPMYDRSELLFVTCHLLSPEKADLQNEELNLVCSDPTSAKSALLDWLQRYHQEIKDEACSVYHYYLKVKYDCSGFNGAVDEESYLLTLRVFDQHFEFVSYLFESQFCKGQPLSSLPLFVKKM